MKIVFFGTPKYAAENLINIIQDGYDVIAVVTQPDKKRGRGKGFSPSPVKQAGLDYGIPVYTTHSLKKDKLIKELLLNLNADVYLVVAFGQILPKEILEQPSLGCWNSHASLLPRWRGAAPIHWSIMKDEENTGICIMAMEEGLDTGPVIAQEKITIDDTYNLEILTNKLSIISSKLLVKSLEKIKLTKGLNTTERLVKLNAIEQSKLTGKPTYARQINKDDFLIDWNQGARMIYKKIQGLYPNTYTLHNGKRIKIIEAIIIKNNDKLYVNQQIDFSSINSRLPGEIIMIKKDIGIIVMTKTNPILIKYGQLEGKKISDGYILSLQSNLSVKTIIGN